jgi:FkbH-like protein
MTREIVDQFIAAGEGRRALSALGTFWKENPRPSAANVVLSRFSLIRDTVSAVSCKLAILRSFTVEPLVPLLRASAAVAGIDLKVQVGDFNAYVQEILDPASVFYQSRPTVAILAVQSRDVAPDLFHDFARLSREQVRAAIDRVTRDYGHWVETIRSRSESSIVIHNLETPATPLNGILDAQQGEGQTAAFREINHALAALPGMFPGVYVLDYDGLTARHGKSSWFDAQNWAATRLPISVQCLPHMVAEWLRFLHPLTGKLCKAIAVDLDNTLWGGVIGEDGMSGIALGAEYPGVAFQTLQRVLLDLAQRGILLAVCSKNNPADALEALEKHPGMLLRPAHFAALRMNWNDKAANLREIAQELNIGIDAIAFLDDNPVEREWVRGQLPEVTVIDLPPDPMNYASALREAPVFERLSVSAEDRERNRYYSDQRLRSELERSASSVEEFCQSLDMSLQIAPVGPQSLTRAAQLTQKTNQFNVTTRRYSEPQITAMADAGSRIFTVGVTDRFGDNGIVGLAIIVPAGDTCRIDTFLLSCRVIGRGVETAMLSFLACQARAAGATRLAGEFIPTKKNAPARDFYANHGFQCVSSQEDRSLWEFDLLKGTIPSPAWFKISLSESIEL